MSHYKSNLRDIEFNLFEVFGREAILGTGPYAELDVETAHGILREVERLATDELAASFVDADRNPPVFDPQTATVTLPESFRKSIDAYFAGEWFRINLPPELGGYGAPPSLRWAVHEFILGSNPAVHMYGSGPAFASVLWRLGTDDQRGFAELMVDRRWGATMVLTEPDAGSDVGAGTAKAIQQPDGSWHIEGVKRFITSGEWDWPENIIHFVLARPEGAAAGTKGLSMFIVPKYLVDDDGTLGERNGVYVTNVERKMGLKVSTTCELRFGEKHPAVGHLVGDVHDGIAQMFTVIEAARMMVGTKAIATLSTGYLNALDYAKNRIQGADLTRFTDKSAPRVPITHHPDVRRMLMLQKSYVEGMRALVLYTATLQDAVEISRAAGAVDEAAEHLNDLLLPIVKGYGSEKSYELLATSLQVLGGSGYLQDYPIEQYIRDAKIDTLYEGTTGIQAMDLFFRKIVRDQGRALATLRERVLETVKAEAGNGALQHERVLLGEALEDVETMVGTLVEFLTSSADEPRNLYKVGLNTNRLLTALGELVVAWLLVRQAEVALAALDGAAAENDGAFYRGKVAAARFFARTRLPLLAAERRIVESTDLDLMSLDEAGF